MPDATRDEEDRPVHVDYNVGTGVSTVTAVTDAEWDEIEARAEWARAEQSEREEQDQRLRQQVAAHPDPVVQALARRAGL